MKRLLILGANGQLGSDLVRVIADTDNFESISITRDKFDAERQSVEKSFPSFGDYDVIINCISYHKTDECEDNAAKSYDINSRFVGDLACYAKANDKTLIHISTDYIFDGRKTEPYIETDSAAPLNLYGISKLAGEFAVRQYAGDYYLLRVSSLFGVAGASGKGGNFVETMLRMARENKPLKVVADQFMAPTHTLDIAKAILSLTKAEAPSGIYHCCNSGQCSWHQFAREIFDQCGIEANLSETKLSELKMKAARPIFSVLDNRKLAVFHAMPPWKNALGEYLKLKGHLTRAARQ